MIEWFKFAADPLDITRHDIAQFTFPAQTRTGLSRSPGEYIVKLFALRTISTVPPRSNFLSVNEQQKGAAEWIADCRRLGDSARVPPGCRKRSQRMSNLQKEAAVFSVCLKVDVLPRSALPASER